MKRSVYSGVCYTTNTEKEFAIILKMARLTKYNSLRGQKIESISKAPSKTLILPGKDVVQVIAKDLPVTMDGISSDLLNARQQELMLDSNISQLCHLEGGRELAPWVPDDDIPQCPELENIFDGPWNRLLFFPNGRVMFSHMNFLNSIFGSHRIQENLHAENDGIKEFSEEQILTKDAQVQKAEDSLHGMQDGADRVGLSPNATAYAPSPHASSKSQDKAVSHGELSNAVAPVKGAGEMPAKGAGEAQSVTSRGRPGSSASSNSDRVGVTLATGGRGLSPSSSLGSLSSEKSTLNPHAKEFKLNPNAKSFTPSHGPVRPPSPVADGSYYFQPNVSALPHMHGIPMGIGIGPSFTGHQPVIFNPPVAPLQTPQAYFHPGGPQYGQQMLLGHSRPLVYMPNYQPEMPYKGREF